MLGVLLKTPVNESSGGNEPLTVVGILKNAGATERLVSP